ncbi:MAG TPA: ABC transporter permease [Bryobacteraceae bacterium]|jgi:predicted permease
MLTSVKHAFRVLLKDPGFTAVAIGSMAIGIGATSAMFNMADFMLLRPLPVSDPDRVVAINTAKSAPFGSNTAISYLDYVDLRDHNRSFEGLVAASYAKFGFSPDARSLARMKFGYFVSGNFFRVLGVRPALGRDFRPDEDRVEGRDAVVVLGHDFWVSQYGASPSVLGSRIRLNGIELTVIGVAPERFTGLDVVFRPTVFVPLAMSPRMGPKNELGDRDAGWLLVKGRLKPGVHIGQARADVQAISDGLQKLHAQANKDRRLTAETELQLRVEQGTPVKFLVMLGLLGLAVLLVACANVAGLLLSRARARSREIAVRLAIGAGRGALIRQLLLENLFVAIAGGVGGLAVTDAFAQFWRSYRLPSDLPIVLDIGTDHRVLLFALVVSVLSTLLFGLAPAFRVTRPDLVRTLKAADADSGGKHRLWGRNLIVAGQVALSLVLLAVSAALVQGFRGELMQGAGFRTDRLFLTSFDTQLARYSEDRTQRFYDDLLRRTRSAPGVRSAALVSAVPMGGWEPMDIFVDGFELPPDNNPLPRLGAYVSDGYFGTMGIPILAGRGFRESDRKDTPPVAVVNEHVASHYWPKGDAVGKRFHLGAATGPVIEIVGVARDSKYTFVSEPPKDFVYLPFRQYPRTTLVLVAESNVPDAGTLAPVLRDVVRSLDPDMPVFDIQTMQDFFAEIVAKTTFLTRVVASMGLMGLLLAVVGLYGLVAYSVSRRTREIGIRMAVGADQRNVVWMVLQQGLQLGAAGVSVGLVLSFFACRMVVSVFSIVRFNQLDPLIFVALPLLLLLVMVLATWAPARKASLIDPMRALRDE